MIMAVVTHHTLHTFHAADVSRRQVTKVSTISGILEFVDYIWNLHVKCIQIGLSTNMPDSDIGLEIREISRILRNRTISYGW